MKTLVRENPLVKEPSATQKKFYEDQYAKVSFVESIPCIKVKLSGVPRCSEHYQFVNSKLVEYIQSEISNYCRLHLLTDSSEAGLILEEDMSFYRLNIIPALEKAGIRYHAVVLPEGFLARLFVNQTSLSTKKLKVEYFNTVSGACKWLRNR
jgi:hypothetical protein